MKKPRGQLSLFSPATATPSVLTVSELTAQIKGTLEARFDDVVVTGEISNAKLYPSGHWYFSLKDKEATISAVCFKAQSQQIRFALEDGLEVVARGKISVWAPRGNYQLTVSSLEPVGIGSWQLAFEQLKEKLSADGLLDPARKRPIPAVPRRIGVVTSQAGAALQDILTALKRRNPNVKVLIAPAKVQGEGSSEEIALALQTLQNFADVEVIIVARGGGSIEDLWSFNTELVARAVAASKVPVISGVGHETDITICDLVADLRAPTPTAAAELVARGREELTDRLINLRGRLFLSIDQKTGAARYRLMELDPRKAVLKHQERLYKMQLRLTRARQSLGVSMTAKLVSARHRLQRLHEKLYALSAQSVLERGFSILQSLDGTVIRKANEVKQGDLIKARLSSGVLSLRVESTDPIQQEQT